MANVTPPSPSLSPQAVPSPGTDDGDKPVETFYTPIYVITAVFGAIFIFGPLLVRKGENKEIIKTCIMLTAFCMWLFWVTVYIAQMNPLMELRVSNTTLAWMAYTWGDPATNGSG